MAKTARDEQIRSTLLQLLKERGPGKTACPSAVARKLADEEGEHEAWRDLMPRVRSVAQKLAEDGRIEVTQGGETVRIDEASGPVRLGLPLGKDN